MSTRVGRFAIGALAVGLLGCFWPLFQGRLFLYSDLGNMYVPMRLFYADELAQGRLALWIPHLFTGFPLHADGEVGMLHPLHWLLYRWLPFSAAFSLESVLAYPFAFFGMAGFLRRAGLPTGAAATGGLVFGLSTFTLVRLAHPNVLQIVAHVPWLLWAVEHGAQATSASGRLRASVWVGAAVGSQLLMGHPPTVVLALTPVAGWALYRSGAVRSPWPLTVLASGIVLGALLGAAQWMPTWEWLAHTLRSETSLEYRMAESLHPWNLLQPIAPYLFRGGAYADDLPNALEQAFYFGAALPIALAWIFARASEREPRSGALPGLLVAASLVVILLALGRYGGLYALYAKLPIVGEARIPARQTFALHVIGAAAIAWAMADLMRVVSSGPPTPLAPRTRYAVLAVPAASLLLALSMLAVRAREPEVFAWAATLSSPSLILVGPLLSVGCAALWLAAASGRRAALPLLLLFIAFDQSAYAVRLWWVDAPRTLAEHLASVPRVPGSPPGRVALGYSDRIWRDAEGYTRFDASTRLIAQDTRLVWGYAGLTPRRALHPFHPANLALAGVVRVWDGKRLAPWKGGLPRFRLLSEVRVVEDVTREIGSIDLRTTALVDAPLSLDAAGPPGQISVERDDPGRMRVEVEAPGRRLLVVSESHDPGWHLAIDGVEAPVLRVNGAYIGAVVDAGRHTLAFDYRPASLRTGVALSAGGLVACAGLSGLAAFRRRD